MGRLNHTIKRKFLQLWEVVVLDATLAFGKVLRTMRREAGLTQEQLGLDADLRRTYISILELGQQQPSLTTLFKLATALNCSAQSIIANVESEMKKKR